MSRWRAPAWAWLLTVAGCALFLSLGSWQLRRAQDKRDIIASYAAATQAPAAELDAALAQPERVRAVEFAGRPQADRQLLHDSQTQGGRAGYHVWTPVRVAEHQELVLVNRGWVPGSSDRAVLPLVPVAGGARNWRGLWRPLPRAGLRAGANDCDRSYWPHVVQYPTVAELECLLDQQVAGGILLLAPDQPDGYVRDWQPVDMPPEKHVAYAVQWFGLAAAVFVIFIVVNLRPSRSDS